MIRLRKGHSGMKIILSVLLTIFIVFSCKNESEKAALIKERIHLKQKAAQNKVAVGIAQPKVGSIRKTITIYGTLKPKRQTRLSSQFNGRLQNLHVVVGDYVRKGQTIAAIFSPKAEVLNSQKAQADKLRREVQPFNLVAPFSGTVTQKMRYSGDVVAAGEAILQIMDDSDFYLWGQLPAVYLPQVKTGQNVRIVFPDLAEAVYTGFIEAVNGATDAQTQTVPIRISVRNKNHLLKAHLFAKITIVLKKFKQVLLLPRRAVLLGQQGFFVFIKKNGRAQKQALQTALVTADSIAVASGLTSKDSVIVLGNYELKNDMAVKEAVR